MSIIIIISEDLDVLKSWLDEGGCFHFLRVLVLGAERGWSKKIALTVRPATVYPPSFRILFPLSTFHPHHLGVIRKEETINQSFK